jgi:GNAT superfamily N-acetyltransferase
MLTVRNYNDGEAFWREVAQPLSVQPIETNVFVGAAYRHRGNNSTELLRVGVFGGEKLVLGGMRLPPFRMQLAHIGDGERAIGDLVHFLAERRIKLPGIMGNDPLPTLFARAWQAATGQGISRARKHGLEQNLYEVKRVIWPNVPGRMRVARKDERDLLIAGETNFAIDGGLPEGERDPAFIAKLVDDGLAEQTFGLWEVDGAPVSTARLRLIGDYASRVSGVYTPPALRGRGYAAALTAALSQKVLDEGRLCCLFADAANPLTNRLYPRVGYTHVAHFTDLLFDET